MIDPADLLATWEAGTAAGPAHRALLLHALARPADDAGRLLAVPVGERDADLLTLRGTLFGERASVRLACRQCAEDLEFDVDVRQALGIAGPAAEIPPAGPAADVGEPGRHSDRPGAPAGRAGPPGDTAPIEVTHGQWRVRFRVPTPGDLLAAAQAPPEHARATLLARCVLDARKGRRKVGAADLPPAVQARVAEAAAANDPHADITFDVPCPVCGHRTKASLDAAAFLWAELDAWARGTLLEVHLLAATYGWSEPEVLALSPLRRRHYLELAGHA